MMKQISAILFAIHEVRWLHKSIPKFEYSRTCVKSPKICFQCQLSLNAGQKYCRMLKREHSAILSAFIKLPFVIKTFVLSILHRFYCTLHARYQKDSHGVQLRSDHVFSHHLILQRGAGVQLLLHEGGGVE